MPIRTDLSQLSTIPSHNSLNASATQQKPVLERPKDTIYSVSTPKKEKNWLDSIKKMLNVIWQRILGCLCYFKTKTKIVSVDAEKVDPTKIETLPPVSLKKSNELHNKESDKGLPLNEQSLSLEPSPKVNKSSLASPKIATVATDPKEGKKTVRFDSQPLGQENNEEESDDEMTEEDLAVKSKVLSERQEALAKIIPSNEKMQELRSKAQLWVESINNLTDVSGKYWLFQDSVDLALRIAYTDFFRKWDEVAQKQASIEILRASMETIVEHINVSLSMQEASIEKMPELEIAQLTQDSKGVNPCHYVQNRVILDLTKLRAWLKDAIKGLPTREQRQILLMWQNMFRATDLRIQKFYDPNFAAVFKKDLGERGI